MLNEERVACLTSFKRPRYGSYGRNTSYNYINLSHVTFNFSAGSILLRDQFFHQLMATLVTQSCDRRVLYNLVSSKGPYSKTSIFNSGYRSSFVGDMLTGK